ncbi:MAG: hypothetical protein QOJ46_403 [bacterium]|jgi:hypothetical protein
MTDPTTPADRAGAPLKRDPAALDSCSAMRTHELRLRIQRADYVVDPAAVAVAMLRHALSQRRWWNPVVVCRMPPAVMTTSGGPATTDPTHVNSAASSAAARSSEPTQTHSS